MEVRRSGGKGDDGGGFGSFVVEHGSVARWAMVGITDTLRKRGVGVEA